MNSSVQTLNLNNTNVNTNISTSKATTNVVNLKLNSIGINSKNIVNNFSSYNTDSNDILNKNGFTEREYTLEELLEESDKYRRNEFIAGKSIYAEYDIISAALSELSFSERLLLDTNAVCSELSLTREKDFETILEEAEAYRKKIAEKIAKDKKAASNVENIINKIKPPITLDLANDVNNALAAYESLTADQIKYLDEETIKKLEAAKKEIDRLEAEKKAKELEIAQKKQELEDLYKKREANNGIFHPQIEDEIEKKILKLEKELGVPHKPDGFESFVDSATNVIDTIQDYAQTAVVSFTTGVLDVVEGIGDGIIMAGGALSSSVVGIFDEEMAAEIEAATQSIVQYDWTNKIYDETMAALDVDPEIAYGKLHSITSVAGTMVGYAALSMIPGGAVVVAAASGLAAMGSASENAFRNGATFDEALAVGTSNAIIGAISGGATSKIGALAKGSTSILQATGYTLAGVGIGAGEPLLNSVVEYATYGNNDGKSYLEFMDQSGGWWNVGIGAGAGGLSTGFQGFKGYIKNKYKADFNTKVTDSNSKVPKLTNESDLLNLDVKKGNNMPTMDYNTSIIVNGNTVENNILEVINRHDFKYGQGDALNRLNDFFNPNSPNFHNYQLITSSYSAREIFSMYTPDQILHSLDNLGYISNSANVSSFFSQFGSSLTSKYGVDQGGIESLCVYTYKGNTYTYSQAMQIYNDALNNGKALPHFTKQGTSEYFKLKNKLIYQGFSDNDASVLLSTIDDAGACSYAATANEIFASFKDKEEEFFKKFGYSMYKQLDDGRVELNSNELLMDLYISCNKLENGGGFILPDNTLNPQLLRNDRYDVFGRKLLDAENQIYLSELYSGKNVFSVSKFLESKGISYSSERLMLNMGSVIDDNTFINLLNKTYEELYSGKSLTLDIFSSGNTINMYSTNPNLYSSISTSTWSEGGGHSIFITGVGPDCFYVSSWGQEYSIPFNDLKNGGVFNIFSATMN